VLRTNHGLGASGYPAGTTFGLGASGYPAGTTFRLVAYEIAKFVAAIASTVMTSERKRFAVVDISCSFGICVACGGLDSKSDLYESREFRNKECNVSSIHFVTVVLPAPARFSD
jgi:hypothetical protein